MICTKLQQVCFDNSINSEHNLIASGASTYSAASTLSGGGQCMPCGQQYVLVKFNARFRVFCFFCADAAARALPRGCLGDRPQVQATSRRPFLGLGKPREGGAPGRARDHLPQLLHQLQVPLRVHRWESARWRRRGPRTGGAGLWSGDRAALEVDQRGHAGEISFFVFEYFPSVYMTQEACGGLNLEVSPAAVMNINKCLTFLPPKT